MKNFDLFRPDHEPELPGHLGSETSLDRSFFFGKFPTHQSENILESKASDMPEWDMVHGFEVFILATEFAAGMRTRTCRIRFFRTLTYT